ncbi:MAG: NAD(P)-dependent alcohol dehydrogenase [Clostridia bacterium]|nr:NAD(P)-dependent alcohol dehydrogenase [Clostridia bacterium]
MSNKTFYQTGLEKMEVGEAPMPKIGPDDVMIKVQSVGVCGSDLHYYRTGEIGSFKVKFPFILGHEAAGVVCETGANVKNLKAGDRVCMEPGIPCMKCEECLTGHYNLCRDVRFWATPPYDGVLSEYVSHPAAFTFKIPDNMSFTEGALVEPLAIGLHACNMGGVKLGQTVAIVGAGCIGLVTLMAAKAYGATRIVVGDMLDKRLAKARELGAVTVNTAEEDFADKVMELTGGRGADVAIDCAGFTPTVDACLRCAKPAGMVVIVGLGAAKVDGFNTDMMSTKELTVKSIFRYRNLYPTAINAIADGRIDVKSIVSHRFAFDDTIEAFATCTKDIRNVVKGVIEY